MKTNNIRIALTWAVGARQLSKKLGETGVEISCCGQTVVAIADRISHVSLSLPATRVRGERHRGGTLGEKILEPLRSRTLVQRGSVRIEVGGQKGAIY